MSVMIKEKNVVDLLKTKPEKALKILYEENFSYLCFRVFRIFPDWNVAEDIVQEVFLEVWKKRKELTIRTNFRSYLRRSVVNRTLNYIRDQKLVFEDEEKASSVKSKSSSGLDNLQTIELEQRIGLAIDSLPQKCRIIFGMNRFEEMSYAEIANKLEISVKTVENQISKALKILREKLKDSY